VFTGKELSPDEYTRLHAIARSVVVKGVESPERLLDETSIFLHRVVGKLPAEKQKLLERLRASDENLVNRQVLVVDDDVRNIFALSSVLERRGMKVLTANTGQEAIDTLDATDNVSIVLMDIMMPWHGWLRGDTRNTRPPGVPAPSHHCAHCKGNEGRSRQVP
jgi:hypothetical protein